MNPPQGNERQPKAIKQRVYRRREGDDFNELRDTVKQLDDYQPETRREILLEATRLLKKLRDENAALRRQVSMMSPTPGSGGNSFGSPGHPLPHDDPHGLRGGTLAASQGFSRTNNNQAPGTSQSHASNALLLSDSSMPEVDRLLRLLEEDFQRLSDDFAYDGN